MTIDLKTPRNDIVFLRRRLKPGETATVKTVTVTRGIKLGFQSNQQESTETTTVSTVEKISSHTASIPVLKANTKLTSKNPVIRLTRMQSGIGVLTFKNVAYFAWETKNRQTGFCYSDDSYKTDFQSTKTGQNYPFVPEISTPEFGNRDLMEYVDPDNVVLSARHINQVRRIVLMPKAGKTVTVTTVNGLSINVEYSQDTVLYMSVIDKQIELRLEKIKGNVFETFRIGTYTPIEN